MAKTGTIYEYGEFRGTVAEAARYFKLNEQTLRTRLDRGWKFAEAVSTPTRDMIFHEPARAINIGDFRGTHKDIFKRFGVKLHTKERASDEVAVKKIQRWRKIHFYSIPYKNYKGSLQAISQDFGCPLSVLNEQIKNGLTPEQILKNGGY